MSALLIQDKYFVPYISQEELEARVQDIGKQLAVEYAYKKPLLLCILNGSFIFAADLVRSMDIVCQVSFIKFSSYQKDQSTGDAKALIGLNESIKDRHVIVVEDIVDTGNTMFKLIQDLEQQQAASIKIATCLFKPTALQKPIQPHYVGFTIPEYFVIGYGLDYDNYGRHLCGIYRCEE